MKGEYMIHQKAGGQFSKTISHYKILEKLDEKDMPSIFGKYNKIILIRR
jgi:hypothetical protein